MGRISRVLKGASAGRSNAPPLRQINIWAFDDDLARLTACWPHLPAHFRDTILSLVEVTEAHRRPPETVRVDAAKAPGGGKTAGQMA